MEKSGKAISKMGDGRECSEDQAGQRRVGLPHTQISETCYRYERKFDDESAEIADWLVRLTTNRKTWGFGLCFLYQRNVKGFGWNHKRVYRIYCELELNLCIRPRKRLKRPKADELAVP